MTRHREPLLDQIIAPAVLQALAASLQPIPPPPALKAKILQRVRSQAAPTRLLTLRADDGDWVPFVPGVEMKMLFEDPARRSRSLLIRMQPGATVPGHPHPDHEECLVLDGEISIGDLTVRAGDYHLAPKGLSHPAITSRTGALLFVRAGYEPAVPG